MASRRGELEEEEHNIGGVSKFRRKRQSEASTSASAEVSAYKKASAYISTLLPLPKILPLLLSRTSMSK